MAAIAEPAYSSEAALPVCLWKENPNRLVSLLRLLQIYAHRFVKIIENLQMAENYFAAKKPNVAVLGPLLRYVEEDCRGLQLTNSIKQLNRIADAVKEALSTRTFNCEEFHVLLSELHIRILEDLEDRVFFSISPDVISRFFKRVENEEESVLVPKTPADVFGERAVRCFPKAILDFNECSRCMITGCDTACIFHLMRIAEHGLRRLALRLKVQLTHSGKAYPIELGDWEQMITGIKNKIAGIRQSPKGTKKQAQLELYSDAADHCSFMKDIFRNNVSHTRKPYTHAEALAAFGRVRDFIIFLAASLGRMAA